MGSGVREALRGLTLRGRAFLAAGVTAVVCAMVLGVPALTRAGILVAVLPLVTAAFLGRSRYRLALVRTVNPQLVTAGQPARPRVLVVHPRALPGCRRNARPQDGTLRTGPQDGT